MVGELMLGGEVFKRQQLGINKIREQEASKV